ncbi:MAG: response regulator transcription factor [Nakamurella sp.]
MLGSSDDKPYAAKKSAQLPDDSALAAELRHTPPEQSGDRSDPITIVIIEDHQLVADGFQFVLNSIPELSVLAIANNCAEGLAAVGLHRPDILLLDQWLPDCLGIEQIPALLGVCDTMKVLVVTADARDSVVVEAISAGAIGVIVKGKRSSALVAAVQAAARGDAVVTPDVLNQIVRTMTPVDQRRDRIPHE